MEKEKDPVCGMLAAKEHQLEYKGRTYHFCSLNCRNRFAGSPERYIKYAGSSEEESVEVRKIAYFSMEIGIDPSIPTYSGGLGVLAGDAIKACADLKVPIVAVTLLYRKGHFLQKLDDEGNQEEKPEEWRPEGRLEPLSPRVQV